MSKVPVFESKKCTKCGEIKDLRFFHIQKAGKYGRKAVCKKCAKMYSAENEKKYSASKTAILYERKSHLVIEKSYLLSRGENKCQRCRDVFPISYFRFNKKASRLENTCKNCLKENQIKSHKKYPGRVVQKEWVKNNRGKVRERARKSYYKYIDKYHDKEKQRSAKKTAIQKEINAKSIIEKSHLLSLGKIKCIKCGEIKMLRFFSKDGKTKSGFRANCKKCGKSDKYNKNQANKTAIRCEKDALIIIERSHLISNNQRRCYKCHEVFLLTSKSRYVCNKCNSLLFKKMLAEHGDKYRAESRNWYTNNKEKQRESQIKWNNKNKDKVRFLQKKWRNNNKERANELCKKSYQRRKSKVLKHARNMYYLNIEYNQEKGRLGAKSLTNCYLASLMEISTKDCPSDLLELKREALMMKRDLGMTGHYSSTSK